LAARRPPTALEPEDCISHPEPHAPERGPVGIGLFLCAALLALYFVPRDGTGVASQAAAIELLVFGFAVGAYGTMVGAGGGFLVVPAMLLVYHARPEQAVGTSLAVVFLNALSGTVSYARQKRVDYKSGVWFAIATVPGSISGAYLSGRFSGRTFDLVFGILMLALAGLLIWRPAAEEEYALALIEDAGVRWWQVDQQMTDAGGETYLYRYNLLVGISISFVVGFTSSMMGIGGGIVHVPALIYLLGFPAHIAAATSHFMLAISAGLATASHLSLGHVLTGPAILMGIGAVGGAQVGARLARRLHGARILRFLSLALAIVGLRLLLR